MDLLNSFWWGDIKIGLKRQKWYMRLFDLLSDMNLHYSKRTSENGGAGKVKDGAEFLSEVAI